jgi:hypothetical protein
MTQLMDSNNLVESPVQTDLTNDQSAPQIMKLTLFMTPTQWDRLWKWSVPLVVQEFDDRGSGKGPWLHMEHEVNKYDEYQQCIKHHQQVLQHHFPHISFPSHRMAPLT